jgi:hypothetical protein
MDYRSVASATWPTDMALQGAVKPLARAGLELNSVEPLSTPTRTAAGAVESGKAPEVGDTPKIFSDQSRPCPRNRHPSKGGEGARSQGFISSGAPRSGAAAETRPAEVTPVVLGLLRGLIR